ncbi:hypothetical protein CMI37_05265 [Candidatus Pacearchaeota archaeon]|nr:hypothetical protein [Candidatus Pacearchaeota archaeon]|tara:strand:- start:2571 stop:2984 length:414 start_codon:yes stop_codon:yes gene_type:complete
MALVKLKNVGTEPFVGIWDNEEYIIDPDPKGESFIIVDEKIAKRWLGNWDAKTKEDKLLEAKRIKMYTRKDPKPEWDIKIEKVVEKQRKKDFKKVTPPPIDINPLVTPPTEEEFADLKEIEKPKKSGKKKDKAVSKS